HDASPFDLYRLYRLFPHPSLVGRRRWWHKMQACGLATTARSHRPMDAPCFLKLFECVTSEFLGTRPRSRRPQLLSLDANFLEQLPLLVGFECVCKIKPGGSAIARPPRIRQIEPSQFSVELQILNLIDTVPLKDRKPVTDDGDLRSLGALAGVENLDCLAYPALPLSAAGRGNRQKSAQIIGMTPEQVFRNRRLEIELRRRCPMPQI